MAILSPIHWDTVTPLMRQTLRLIGANPLFQQFYLAGGTALALRLGHRRSIDLDFFSFEDRVDLQTRNKALEALETQSPMLLENVDGELLLRIANLHIGFFSYRFPLLEPSDSVEGVALASVVDIGLMRLDALVGRGSRKDFYDLYFIAQQLPLLELLERGQNKYPQARDFALMAVESMIMFENADRDHQPTILADLPWPQVRDFFVNQARMLGQHWFGV